MTDTGWMFRASWPILRPELPMGMLRAEACREIDEMAHEANCRIVGEVSWSVVDGRLYAHAPAAKLAAERGSVMAKAPLIGRMARSGMTDRRIADSLGCSESAVAKVRQRSGVAPGVGNPVLSGQQQQRKGKAA